MGDLNKQLTSVALANAIEMQGINDVLILSLAKEVAQDIEELPVILGNHGISMKQFEELLKRDSFLKILREEKIRWGAAVTASERIKTKMEYMVEASLPALYEELHKPGLTTPKVELLKTMMKGGGIGVQDREGNVGERVEINISLGSDTPKITKNFVIDHEAEEAA